MKTKQVTMFQITQGQRNITMFFEKMKAYTNHHAQQMMEIRFPNISISILTIRCNRKQETQTSITHHEVQVNFQKDEHLNSQLLYLAYLL